MEKNLPKTLNCLSEISQSLLDLEKNIEEMKSSIHAENKLNTFNEEKCKILKDRTEQVIKVINESISNLNKVLENGTGNDIN